jgi:hypothetical protein
VVSGSEAHGVSLALVRNDLVAAFCRAFDGRPLPGLVGGWTEVADCRVTIGPSAPIGLEGALQLLPTMHPRGVSFVGGIRVPGGFLRFQNYLPRVQARGANSVIAKSDGSLATPCHRSGTDDDEWTLPESVVPAVGTVAIEATWSAAGDFDRRQADTSVVFVNRAFSDDFKTLPAGEYRAEGCGKPEIEIQGPTAVELEFVGDRASASADLLMLDGTVRYLGPGIGQMSLQPKLGFDWMVAGPAGRPDVLAFIGDPNSPTPPADAQSSSAGDRRHWRHALGSSRSMVVRHPDGSYSAMRDYPSVWRARTEYLRHKISREATACEATGLSLPKPPGRPSAATAPIAREAWEALAALSVRRSGLHYSDLRSLLIPLVGSRPLAIQQVLRAWAECGLVDVVRDARRGALTICARPPSVVLVRRGPVVEATVYGLVCQTREDRLREALQRHQDLAHDLVSPPNDLQPPLHRIRGAETSVLALATDAGIRRSAWLTWPDAGAVPESMDVNEAFRRLPVNPPHQYAFNAGWDWTIMSFRREGGSPSHDGVAIERRLHPTGSSIYVVLSDGASACWTAVRNWALLFGYELAGRQPFVREVDGTISCKGLSPVHLPLPIARLCAIIGAGLPGPVFAGGEVVLYRYPFGTRLYSLVAPVIPPSWIRDDFAGG